MCSLIHKAFLKRARVLGRTNALRLFNGSGDGIDGLLIDLYHRHAQVQLLGSALDGFLPEIEHILRQRFDLAFLIVKERKNLDLKSSVRFGGDPRTTVMEYGYRFAVDLNDGLNAGLFLDMRANRYLVGQMSFGKRVLNCFAYTCAFGVHARAAGAQEVVNVDISPKVLARGRQNYALNHLSEGPGEFARADTRDFLTRARKKDNRFDVIILDPPSFARHGKDVFQVKRDLPKLIEMAAAVLNPKGSMLISTNFSGITHADLKRMLSKASGNRKVKRLIRLGQDEDFTGTNTFKESYLAAVWVEWI